MVYIHSLTLVDFLCLASFLFPFYADELTTMAVRIKDGESLNPAPSPAPLPVADQRKASAPLAGVDPLWSDPTTGGPEHSVLSKLRVANGSSPLGDLFHRLYHGRSFPAVVPESKPGDRALGQHSGYYQSG